MPIAYNLAGALAELALRIKDTDNRISSASLENFIEDGLNKYTIDRPRRSVSAALLGNGTKILPLPAGWIVRFSVLSEIEFPIGNVPRSMLDPRGWEVHEEIGTGEIHTISTTLGAADSYRLTFSRLHTILGYPSSAPATATTIPAPEFLAVVLWGASKAALTLAASYANTNDPTVASDVVNYRSKSQEYRDLAESLQDEYERIIHPDEKDQGGASQDVNFDLSTSVGTDLLFHQAGFR